MCLFIRWLLVSGRVKEAEDVIRAAARFNETDLGPFSLAPMVEKVDDANFLDFLKPGRRELSFPLWTVWLCFGFVYYGIILFVSRVFSDENVDDDDDNTKCSFAYQEIFISAASEVLGVAFTAVVIDR